MLHQERGVPILAIHSESLVGRDENTGILGGLTSHHLRRIGTEEGLDRARTLFPQFFPVADEESPRQLPCIGETPQEMGGNKGLSRARRQRKQGPTLRTGSRHFFKHGPDRGILVIAALRFAGPIVGRQERLRGGVSEFESHPRFIALPQLAGSGKVAQGFRLGLETGEVIVFDEKMAVRRKNKRHVQSD